MMFSVAYESMHIPDYEENKNHQQSDHFLSRRPVSLNKVGLGASYIVRRDASLARNNGRHVGAFAFRETVCLLLLAERIRGSRVAHYVATVEKYGIAERGFKIREVFAKSIVGGEW